MSTRTEHEMYTNHLTPYQAHTVVAAMKEDQWTYPSLLCYSIYHLQAKGDVQGATATNNLMVSGLVVNGIIEMWMKMQREGKL